MAARNPSPPTTGCRTWQSSCRRRALIFTNKAGSPRGRRARPAPPAGCLAARAGALTAVARALWVPCTPRTSRTCARGSRGEQPIASLPLGYACARRPHPALLRCVAARVILAWQ
eukprot:scaffold12988_cov112-Isochrysis_galbana.AAC.5